MTYPSRQDVNENRNRLKRLLDIAWMEADAARETCKPGSKEELDYLEQQRAIEALQATL